VTSLDVPKRVAVVLYDGCVFFEIALALEILARTHPIICYTPNGETHRSTNGIDIEARGDYQALAKTAHACVLVPGGNPDSVLIPTNIVAGALIENADRGALVAGICAGNLVLASAGLLRGQRATHNYTAEHASHEIVDATKGFWETIEFVNDPVVRSGSFITALPWAYREFATEVAMALGSISNTEADTIRNYVVRAKERCGV
jgi:transcriptional regulator GlxA family with amidase domain